MTCGRGRSEGPGYLVGRTQRRSIPSPGCATSGIPPSRNPRGRRSADQTRGERALGVPHATTSVSSLLGRDSPHMVIQNIAGRENINLVTHEI